jgi:hypothetical protein
MIQVGSQKYSRMFTKFYFHILTCSQTWLNLCVDDRHFGYTTKLTEKINFASVCSSRVLCMCVFVLVWFCFVGFWEGMCSSVQEVQVSSAGRGDREPPAATASSSSFCCSQVPKNSSAQGSCSSSFSSFSYCDSAITASLQTAVISQEAGETQKQEQQRRRRQQQQQQQQQQVPREAWSNFPRDLMVGAILGGVAHTLVAPVERAKLLLQTQDSNMAVMHGKHTRYNGLMDCIVRIAKNEGILSLWRGNITSVLRYYPSLALNFAFKVFLLLSSPFHCSQSLNLLTLCSHGLP